MNEKLLRNAIRKVIEESPVFKEYLKGKETPLESPEVVSERRGKKPDADGDGVPPWADKDDEDSEVQEEGKSEEEEARAEDLADDYEGDFGEEDRERDAAKDKKKNSKEDQEPLKEWYDNSLYNKLLKETLRRKK